MWQLHAKACNTQRQMNYTKIFLVTLCLATSMGLFAQNSPTLFTGKGAEGGAQHAVPNTEQSGVPNTKFNTRSYVHEVIYTKLYAH